MKNFQFIGGRLWIAYFAIVVIVSISVIIVLNLLLPLTWSVLAGVIILILISGLTISSAYLPVRKNEALIVEIFGSYIEEVLYEGAYFLFPYFNWVDPAALLPYKVEQKIALFGNDENDKVDFLDGVAATVNAKCYFKIIDPKKAFYNVENYEKALKDTADAALRAYMGDKDLEEVNKCKGEIGENNAISSDDIEYIKKRWGIKITDLTVADIELEPEDVNERRRILLANLDLRVAKVEAEKIKTIAKAKAEAVDLEGAGLAKKIQHMSDKGVDHGQIMTYLQEELKWLNLGDKTVVIDNGSGLAGIIAQLKVLGL